MNSSPRVSVLMTTYNGSRYIKQTIESILNQTITDFEFLIIDDNSSDNTVDIIRSYCDARIKLFINPVNLGVCKSRNRGMDIARGEYLAYTDHDDVSLPERLERQIAYLDKHPDIVLAGTAGWYMEENTIVDEYPGILDPAVMHWSLFTQTPLVPSSICMRLPVLRHYNIHFRPGYEYADDVDFFHQVAQIGGIISLPDKLTIYRRHAINATCRYSNMMTLNGQKVYYEAYHNYLEMNLTEAEIKSIWSVFCCLQPAYDENELLQTGALLQAALQRYIKRKQPDKNQIDKITIVACSNWWSAVCRTARALGKPHLIKTYWRFSELSIVNPAVSNLLGAFVRASLPLQLVKFIRGCKNKLMARNNKL